MAVKKSTGIVWIAFKRWLRKLHGAAWLGLKGAILIALIALWCTWGRRECWLQICMYMFSRAIVGPSLLNEMSQKLLEFGSDIPKEWSPKTFMASLLFIWSYSFVCLNGQQWILVQIFKVLGGFIGLCWFPEFPWTVYLKRNQLNI